MKKTIAIFLIAVIVIISVCSCGESGDNNSDSIDESNSSAVTVFKELQNMIGKASSSFTVYINTENSGVKLNSKFTVTEKNNIKNVSYKTEQLSKFDISDGKIVIPDEYITELEGEAVIQNGKITKLSGDSIDMNLEVIKLPNFEFDEENFENVILKDGSFEAVAKSPSTFLGRTVNCSNMTVKVVFSDEKINEILLNFKTEKGVATVEYIL